MVNNKRRPIYLRHDVAEICGADSDFLNTREELCNTLTEISKNLGLTVLKKDHYQFKPTGLTIVFILSESHLVLHTWPQSHFAHLDIVTCSKNVNLDKLPSLVKQYFKTNKVNVVQWSY